MKKRGILIINLGTPADASPEAVGHYLKEFLMDPWVIDIPSILRWILVNILIVPKRKYASSAAYQKVFTDRGSPLLFHSLDLVSGLQRELGDIPVELAMRYGQPGIAKGVLKLLQQGVTEILAAPLYPQYAESSTRSSLEVVREEARRAKVKLLELPAFYHDLRYIDALARVTQEFADKNGGRAVFDHWLMSFHGLPERHIKRLDPSGSHCLKNPDCCEQIGPNNQYCYKAHCVQTARGLARALGLSSDQYTISFQSRLGRAKWIDPNTELVYPELAAKGVRRLAVICPSFVADCLETLEEVQIRGNEIFKAAGGESLKLVPCLNSSPVWVQALASMLSDQRSKLGVNEGEESSSLRV